jgi:hypothetical protein
MAGQTAVFEGAGTAVAPRLQDVWSDRPVTAERRWKVVEMHLITKTCPLTVREYTRFAKTGGAEANRLFQQWLANPYSKEILLDVFQTLYQSSARPGVAPPADQTVLERLSQSVENGTVFLLRPIQHDAAAAADPEILTDRAIQAARARSAAAAARQSQDDRAKKTWVEFQLLDQDGEPVAGARYRLKITDGSVREGSLNELGRVRVNGIDPGTCQISFPQYDGREWKRR